MIARCTHKRQAFLANSILKCLFVQHNQMWPRNGLRAYSKLWMSVDRIPCLIILYVVVRHPMTPQANPLIYNSWSAPRTHSRYYTGRNVYRKAISCRSWSGEKWKCFVTRRIGKHFIPMDSLLQSISDTFLCAKTKEIFAWRAWKSRRVNTCQKTKHSRQILVKCIERGFCILQLYRNADKSLGRPGRKQARKHVRDARDFNNIETRAVIKYFFFLEGNAPKEIHVILTETLACFCPGQAKNLSASLYDLFKVMDHHKRELLCNKT